MVQAVGAGIGLWGLNIVWPSLPGLTVLFGAAVILGLTAVAGAKLMRLALASIATAYALILFSPLTNTVAEALTVRCPMPGGDAIIVLEGDPGHGRILRGLALLSADRARALGLTGIDGLRNGWRNFDIAGQLGVEPDKVFRIPVSASGTHYEAEALQKVGPTRGVTRIVLVTSRIHSRRATLVFRKAGFIVCSSPAEDKQADSDARDPLGRLLMARDLVHEAFAYSYYLARGWI